jgi:hypothetical protein
LGTASFNVAANGQLPIAFQWYKNNVLVNGATSQTYTFGPVTLADNASQIFCIASNNLFSTPFTATSTVAILTVQADLVAASISRARVAGTNQVEVIFSESVNNADAVRRARSPFSELLLRQRIGRC